MRDHICPWWMAYTFDNRLRSFFHKPETLLGAYVTEGMTVLDVGCGMGFFSIGLARLVGSRGTVVAADIQDKMLHILRRRAERAGLSDRIRTVRCEPNHPAFDTAFDFILAFWMVHEVPSVDTFFRQLRLCLNPKGVLFITEPIFHVSPKQFQQSLVAAQTCGLTVVETPSIRFSRSAVLRRTSWA